VTSIATKLSHVQGARDAVNMAWWRRLPRFVEALDPTGKPVVLELCQDACSYVCGYLRRPAANPGQSQPNDDVRWYRASRYVVTDPEMAEVLDLPFRSVPDPDGVEDPVRPPDAASEGRIDRSVQLASIEAIYGSPGVLDPVRLPDAPIGHGVEPPPQYTDGATSTRTPRPTRSI
jgi:hypothetical protein